MDSSGNLEAFREEPENQTLIASQLPEEDLSCWEETRIKPTRVSIKLLNEKSPPFPTQLSPLSVPATSYMKSRKSLFVQNSDLPKNQFFRRNIFRRKTGDTVVTKYQLRLEKYSKQLQHFYQEPTHRKRDISIWRTSGPAEEYLKKARIPYKSPRFRLKYNQFQPM